ncbi:hypothetical protein [Streptomyces sp. NRRL S-350]|uniref:hypothetical protein n=1 Tax=Streptomyces sp. NRRL S-350 TaxID=1463902 RepID=UPI000AF36D07|nr:hypothetical protein [Streptomyces sp. NRRL S-350]
MYDPPAPSAGGMPSVPLYPPDAIDAEARAAAIPPPTVSSTGPWTMTVFDFSDGPEPAPKPVPEQRAAEAGPAVGPAGAPAQPGVDPKQSTKPGRPRLRKAKAKAAAEAAAAAAAAAAAGKDKGGGKGAGKGGGARRPSPLILLSSALLVGGAVSGFFPAMLAGWGLGYLSRQLSDLMRKFVILGIPLITMSGTTLYAMRQAKQGAGQGGGGLQSGSPLGQISWSSAPDVLRLSAVASAVVLLLVAMRRRPPQQG